ncbi:vWA domain-containing protein [Hydrocarboniclastica marina]|uniref:VWA domain-containing protein n=1 Tax=Hydrocarboniclastica marina TaxID=2259620 RepID=A0A4P7XHL3_9ALTE|nr:VWA domain-containing protein [Hydrocarboniclastica marina]QCF26255.1 VWA domain-containing protein [Hydrocarboniclastica marina]
MLIDFFLEVRRARVPASLREFLDLQNALRHHLAFADMEDFYHLARLCLVKDERHFDKFDRAFGAYFEGIENLDQLLEGLIPDDWLRAEFERQLSDEEKAKIESLGGLEELIETFKKRMEEQKERHQGGNKWIGTGGTSPFGANGYNPEGFRIGQDKGRHGRAAKVWEKRGYRDLDDSVTLGIRNIKVALRRLRKFARQGAADQLDLDDTISSTARNAGYLDLKMVPERHNAVKVLLFFDVGGSMDPHVRVCEELFSACRAEFKHMEYFYFHNFVYESVWKDNIRRMNETMSTWDILHKYTPDYKVIFVGDATMAPYEVTHAGGSIEHWNQEPGAVWMERITDHFDKVAWLNPIPREHWGPGGSLGVTRQLVEDRMFPMSIEGLEQAMKELTK